MKSHMTMSVCQVLFVKVLPRSDENYYNGVHRLLQNIEVKSIFHL